MVIASLGRLSYAVGLLMAPETMSRFRLGPITKDNGYATMTTRAFGAVHTNVSLLTIRSARDGQHARRALQLNIGCDLGDLIATILQWREGDLPTGALLGSAAVQSAGIATWTTALRELR